MQHITYKKVGVAPDHNTELTVITRNVDELTGWKWVGYFSSYGIFAKDELRRVVDAITGRVIVEYSIPGETVTLKTWCKNI